MICKNEKCKAEFTPRRKWQLFCSPACRYEWHNEQKQTTDPFTGKLCQWKRCTNPAEGYHCKSCDAIVCREHQEPSGYGNHGCLIGPITILENKEWKRIEEVPENGCNTGCK